MSHCTMDELLALREPDDAEATRATRLHLATCAECREEYARLERRIARMRALPALRPARDAWTAVAAEHAARQRMRWWRLAGLGGLAAAAALALAVLLPRGGAPSAAADLSGVRREIASTQVASAVLEQTLAELRPADAVVEGRTAEVAASLEDRIAVIDDALGQRGASAPPPVEALELWRERVGLLDALVDVHVSRARHVGL